MAGRKKQPELRFKGFSGDWEDCELTQIVDVRSGKDYKHLSNGNIPVYGTGGYMLSVNDALSYDEDAIGIGRKGTIDKPYILKAPFWTVDTLFYGVPKEKNNIEFIYDIFQIINWKLKDESTGVPSLSKVAIGSTQVLIPKSNEQKVIGNYFKNLDNLITLQQRKLDKLSNIKKSLLEKMFPKNEAVVPEIRFKGFSEDWEERKIKDVASFIDGNYGEKYPKENEFIDNGVPFFTSAVIGTTGVFNKKNIKYISEEKNTILVKAQSLGGDLILTNRGASMGAVAQIPLDYGLINIGPQLTRIRGTEKADNLFLLSMFKSSLHNQKLLSINSGSAMNFVGIETLGKFEFKIPKLEEQKKIGKLFYQFDNLITLYQCKLEKLKTIKKFCLEKMFV